MEGSLRAKTHQPDAGLLYLILEMVEQLITLSKEGVFTASEELGRHGKYIFQP